MAGNAPIKVTPKKLSQEIGSELGYAYHATNEERLYEIVDSGKLQTHKPNYGTDQDTWPDGSREKRIYFSGDAKVVWQFAPEEGKPVVIRTKGEGLKTESTTRDLYSVKPISTKGIEFLGEDDRWHSLSDLKKSFGDLQQFLQEEIDQQDDITKKWMVWSNEVLKEEEKWYKDIKSIHKEIEKEIADNLASLDVDENGVLSHKVKASAILFDEKKIKDKVKKVAEKLISDTMNRFGEKAVREANKERNAKT